MPRLFVTDQRTGGGVMLFELHMIMLVWGGKIFDGLTAGRPAARVLPPGTPLARCGGIDRWSVHGVFIESSAFVHAAHGIPYRAAP